METRPRQQFYKLIFSPSRSANRERIYLFYRGVPLVSQAEFAGDRYVFQLPKNLEEKMMAGDPIADLCFSEAPDPGPARSLRTKVPACILLSDRD